MERQTGNIFKPTFIVFFVNVELVKAGFTMNNPKL